MRKCFGCMLTVPVTNEHTKIRSSNGNDLVIPTLSKDEPTNDVNSGRPVRITGRGSLQLPGGAYILKRVDGSLEGKNSKELFSNTNMRHMSSTTTLRHESSNKIARHDPIVSTFNTSNSNGIELQRQHIKVVTPVPIAGITQNNHAVPLHNAPSHITPMQIAVYQNSIKNNRNPQYSNIADLIPI